MGYQLARAVAGVLSPPLSANAIVVLNRMAWAVMDKPTKTQPAAEYWAGWEYLGMTWAAMGRDPEAVRTIVTRALRELVAKGYIKPLDTARKGKRQRYAITLDY